MNYIERNPQKCFSMPSLIGRRLTVYDVVTQINGEGLDLAIEDYEITRDQAIAALTYCSELLCKEDSNQFQFCDGCILRSVADGEVFNRDDYYEIVNKDGTISTFSNEGNLLFGGSIDDLEQAEIGKETWEIASLILNTLE